MSKAAKKSIFILMGLLFLSLGFAVFLYMQVQRANEEASRLNQQLISHKTAAQQNERRLTDDNKKLSDEVGKITNEKNDYVARLKRVQDETQETIKDLTSQVKDITDDRDKWKRRIDEIRAERDQLMTKIADLNKKLTEKPEPQIVYKEKEPVKQPAVDVSRAPTYLPDSGKVVDEQYWANLLKEKASLEIDIQKLKDELSAKSISLVEARQKNENLELAVKTLTHDKEEIGIEMRHKMDMIDNISLELARTKNDKKFIADQVKKLNAENGNLRQEMKKLVTVKNSLEKSIVRVSQEKDKIQGELGRTETIIQSKIDEIWEIKDDLDQTIKSSKGDAASNEVELPPIVVNASGETTSFNTGESTPGVSGKVISVNEPNNFVIVDIGENSGVRLGDNLSVYRDSKYIARLEVIQTRKDISAADLKDQWSKIQVGDIVR